jgi:hypothetical protein
MIFKTLLLAQISRHGREKNLARPMLIAPPNQRTP